MGIFFVTILLFALFAAVAYFLRAALDKAWLSGSSEEQINRLQEVRESNLWWLSRVLYCGFAGMCLFLVATLISVQMSLGELTNVIFHLCITAPISALVTALGYIFIRYLFCRFWADT